MLSFTEKAKIGNNNALFLITGINAEKLAFCALVELDKKGMGLLENDIKTNSQRFVHDYGKVMLFEFSSPEEENTKKKIDDICKQYS